MLLHPSAPVAATAPGGGARAGLALLAILLLAGGWARFGGDLTAMLTGMAGGAPEPRALIEQAMLPQAETAQAIAAMGLPAAQATLLADAVRRNRLRLMRMPLFDAGPGAADAAGHTVRVSAGGYTTTVHLAARPVEVTLPIGPVGSVLFSTVGAATVTIGSMTLSGPVRFPDTGPGQVLDVGVMAQ
jgi:hypothetical protein